MTSRRLSVETPDHFPDRIPDPLGATTWRAAALARTRALDREILATAGLLAVTASAAVLRLAAAGAPAQPGEGRAVAQTFAVDSLGTLLDSRTSPLAWLQVGGYTAATDAFARHTSALGAAREPMVIAAAGAALLLWVLARRIGLSVATATAAVAVTAAAPLAVGLQLGARPENVAVPWLLAGTALLWTSRRHRRLPPDLWGTAFLVVAVITAPVAAVFVVVTGSWLVWRRGRRRLSLMLACLFALGTGIGLGASAALSGLRVAAEGPAAGDWARVDPVFVVAGLLAAATGLLSHRLRPLAAGVLAMAAVAAVPGGPGSGALVVVVAPAALLVAGVVERAVRHRLTGPRVRPHALRLPVVALAVAVVAAAVPAWLTGLRSVVGTASDPAPGAAAARWVRDNLPGAVIATDGITWADLVRGGRSPEITVRTLDCPEDCLSRSWLVITPVARAAFARRPALAEAAAAGEVVAAFGGGADRVLVQRPAADGVVAAGEAGARSRAGAAVAGSNRLTAPGDVHEALREGRADPRVLTALTALSATRPVRVAALPAVAGEDAAEQPRRQVLLTAAGEPAEQLALFFTSQHGVFRPDSVRTTPEGVLVRYPAGVPGGLLLPFDNP
ncbi:glycosyl transferase [Actinokineospora auranticolor]|uniref:4-amino-4-deoxy-L-arabinose transferase-like glycosyltransferase n=1 Tax=Actinokineospora auranticolor TaxID=155976 RepID=A0A2S6GQQ1_9PSEU|nr:glycosyl transferase [Actinokineospora auranticolor]PPK67554.1 hypothetical protein CLV40_107219 [Actinokineospora auranticolor]